MSDKLTYSAREAAAALGVSLPTFYTLSARADFPVIRIGRRIVVPVDGLRRWLDVQSNSKAVV